MPFINPGPEVSKSQEQLSLPARQDTVGPKSKSVTSRIGW
jgi:hypothetical protein